MNKALAVGLILTVASAAMTTFGSVTTAPDHLWEAQQKVKDLQAQVESLQGQVAQLQLQVSSLQTENGSLKAKLEQKDEALRAAATQPIKLTPEAINPPDVLKDYPQDRMPAYGDATNNLRIQALNQYLMGKFAGKPVIVTGKFQSATASGMRGFTVTVLTPEPTTMPRWTVTATFPASATDEILKLKRDDTVTFSGTISRITYVTQAKFSTLTLTLKDASLAK